MATDNRIQVRIDGNLGAWLADRAELMHNGGSPDLQARLELGMWQSALQSELRKIRLTLPQACCIADVCNGWLMDATMAAGVPLVYAECYDAFKIARDVPAGLDPDISSFGAKWGQGADPRAWEDDLLARLLSLSPVADHALRDAIVRWWHLDDRAETAEGFAKVGLRMPGGLYAVYDSTGEQVADLGWQDSDAAALAAADIPPAGTVMRLEPATGRAFSVGPPRPAKGDQGTT